MKAAIVVEAGKPMQIVERPVPEPGPGQARVKVHACGVCHSDQFVRDALWPGLELPRVPGHEVAGVVDAVGRDVRGVEPGQRVGIGWTAGHCRVCEACRAGDFAVCANGTITGISHDGGYAEYTIAPAEALAPLPDALPYAEAAPLLCAGVTTFNALRNAPARAGDLIGVQGLGGLGHLGVQFARAMGFRVAVISRGKEKAALAEKLGAHEYVDAEQGAPGEPLQALGGAKVILATAPHADSVSALLPGLGRNGCLVVVGVAMEPLQVGTIDLISGRRSVLGWPSGHARDSADTLAFAALHDIRPMIETFPLDRAEQAYAKMIEGRARFRSVLEIG